MVVALPFVAGTALKCCTCGAWMGRRPWLTDGAFKCQSRKHGFVLLAAAPSASHLCARHGQARHAVVAWPPVMGFLSWASMPAFAPCCRQAVPSGALAVQAINHLCSRTHDLTISIRPDLARLRNRCFGQAQKPFYVLRLS